MVPLYASRRPRRGRVTRVHDLRGFQRDLLFVVGGLEEPNGREVLEEMEDSLTGEVQAARLYTNLDELAERGLVEKSSKDGRTNLYRLTEEGRRQIEARHEWERERLEFDPDRA